ncbi:MAG: hypothetical protein Q8Q09_21835 [Deltaproteobacteria bacterium]|nr:hypothetical protein [Deltaproteobacteria bacterium]
MKTPRLDSVLRHALWLALSIAPVGCGAVVNPEADGGREGGMSDGGTCVDPSTGRTLRVGESNGAWCPCVCTETGLQCASCPRPVCQLPDGRVLGVGESYDDGCNVCACTGPGQLSCTERFCEDTVTRDATERDATPREAGSCDPIVRTTIGGCEAAVEYPCGVPGGTIPNGNDPRCRGLCEPARSTGADGNYCTSMGFSGMPPRPNTVVCGFCGVGRLTEGLETTGMANDPKSAGDWLADGAAYEAIAAIAFERLGAELQRFGAPSDLIARAQRAAQDERRHASVMAALAAGEGRESAAVTSHEIPARTLADIAIENAGEGCVRETLGAVIMAYQAQHAGGASMREALAQIAREEAEHAQWSWDLDAWARTQLSSEVIDQMDRARSETLASLRDVLTAREPSESLRQTVGMPPNAAVHTMIDSLTVALWQA